MNEDRPRREWFEQALARFERPLVTYAARLLGDVDAARDVVQDTFLRLLSRGEAEASGHLAEWLYTVCRHRAFELMRKEKRMTRLSEAAQAVQASGEPSPAESYETGETTSRALALLERLSGNQREVIRLRFQEELSYRQIASITGLTETNVGFLLHTGLKRLRALLGEGGSPAPATRTMP